MPFSINMDLMRSCLDKFQILRGHPRDDFFRLSFSGVMAIDNGRVCAGDYE
mgnify:CR=1 FL=1